jgi:hypothetical protein
MNTQCPCESSRRRLFIATILSVFAICLLSFNSAQAQTTTNNTQTNCVDRAQTQSIVTDTEYRFTDPSRGFYWIMNSIFTPSVLTPYIAPETNPVTSVTLPKNRRTGSGPFTTVAGSDTTQSDGPCRDISATTTTSR